MQADFNYIFEISDELTALHFKVEGAKFNDSITGQLARGLWEFQREIYKAVAYSLYGQASIRKLTKEDLEKYNIVFFINEGCTDIKAYLEAFLKFLSEQMKDMSPVQKIILITSVFSIITTGVVVLNLEGSKIEAESQVGIELAKIQANKEVEMANNALEQKRIEEQTKQMELLAEVKLNQPALSVWDESIKSGAKSIAKSLEDGDSLSYGDYYLSPETVRQLKQSSPRAYSEEESITDKFTLYGFKELGSGRVQFEIRGASGEYTVETDTETFTAEEINYLSHIAADIGQVVLTIKLITLKDKIKAAFIADFEKNHSNN